MELTLLPDGIYERVISDELGKVLDEASKEEQIWKETETVDSQEGARYLSGLCRPPHSLLPKGNRRSG